MKRDNGGQPSKVLASATHPQHKTSVFSVRRKGEPYSDLFGGHSQHPLQGRQRRETRVDKRRMK